MNVGAKIFGFPEGEPKQHNQTKAQKKVRKTLDTTCGCEAVRSSAEAGRTPVSFRAVLCLDLSRLQKCPG
jgi:hypothetical protein